MRKIVIITALIAVLACSRNQEGYEIKVNLEGAEGSLLLEKRGELGWIAIDTAEVTGRPDQTDRRRDSHRWLGDAA